MADIPDKQWSVHRGATRRTRVTIIYLLHLPYKHKMAPALSILCFGNSLTAGFHQYGLEYHPYAEKLEERLKEVFPSHAIRIDVDGVPGDLVITPPGRFLTRMQEKCR